MWTLLKGYIKCTLPPQPCLPAPSPPKIRLDKEWTTWVYKMLEVIKVKHHFFTGTAGPSPPHFGFSPRRKSKAFVQLGTALKWVYPAIPYRLNTSAASSTRVEATLMAPAHFHLSIVKAWPRKPSSTSNRTQSQECVLKLHLDHCQKSPPLLGHSPIYSHRLTPRRPRPPE